MATSLHANGSVLAYTAGAAISSGDIIVTGNLVGVALTDIANGDVGSVAVEGVFEVTKVAGTAWVQGDVIGWDDSATAFAKTFTATTGDITTGCVAYKAAASGATVGYVKLTPGTGTPG